MPKFNVTATRALLPPSRSMPLPPMSAHYKEFMPLVQQARSCATRRHVPRWGRDFRCGADVAYKKLGISETMQSQVTVDRQGLDGHCAVDRGTGAIARSRVADRRMRATAAATSNSMWTTRCKSRSLQFLLSGMFDMMVRRVMTAFEERAKKLYGTSPSARRAIEIAAATVASRISSRPISPNSNSR